MCYHCNTMAPDNNQTYLCVWAVSVHLMFGNGQHSNVPICQGSFPTLDVWEWTAIKLFWDWKLIVRVDIICWFTSLQEGTMCFCIVCHQCLEKFMSRQIKPIIEKERLKSKVTNGFLRTCITVKS